MLFTPLQLLLWSPQPLLSQKSLRFINSLIILYTYIYVHHTYMHIIYWIQIMLLVHTWSSWSWEFPLRLGRSIKGLIPKEWALVRGGALWTFPLAMLECRLMWPVARVVQETTVLRVQDYKIPVVLRRHYHKPVLLALKFFCTFFRIISWGLRKGTRL